MAMSGDVMGIAVNAALQGLSDADKQDPEKIWREICKKIVDHITTNAVISTNVAVASVSGVTTGPGVSGPGVGTGTGTIA